MNKVFYPKLAFTNIKKNGKFYFPFLLTCIGTIAMFYMMTFIAFNKGMKRMPGSESIQAMMLLGTIIIGIFAVIFLFYTNSFLMKRRRKEFGLYNILGMEKRHIAKIMFFETLIIAFVSLAMGLGCGVLFSKLSIMLLVKMLHFDIKMNFEISIVSVSTTITLFLCIFAAMLFYNFAKIQLSKPIELLYGSKTGEKEPKTKVIMALLGFACLGLGYYIALTTESPLQALGMFFVAVLLVIVGTYLLFTAGTIFVLKVLRKKKSYYYKTKHFTTVSGLLYRMKQNAVGLANICILSTMVLVMVSGTTSLYLGTEDALKERFPNDITTTYYFTPENRIEANQKVESLKEVVKNQGMNGVFNTDYELLSFSCNLDGSKITLNTGNYSNQSSVHQLIFLTAKEYERLMGRSMELKPDEVAVYNDGDAIPNTFLMMDQEYHIKENLATFIENKEYSTFMLNLNYIVVADDSVMDKIYEGQKEAFGKRASQYQYSVHIDLDGTREDKIAMTKKVKEAVGDGVHVEGRDATREEFYSLYGGFLFLGIFLGLLFIMATVLIIYYKQISEGYDDKERFSIMQKVGMSRSEIKKSIHSQILLVFFLPLVTACIHVLAAFKIITKLLSIFSIVNIGLLVACTLGTIICFAVIYTIVYTLTARVYYKIVY